MNQLKRQALDFPFGLPIKTAEDLVRGAVGEWAVQARRLGTQKTEPQPEAKFVPQNLTQKVGVIGENFLRDLTIGQNTGITQAFGQGTESLGSMPQVQYIASILKDKIKGLMPKNPEEQIRQLQFTNQPSPTGGEYVTVYHRTNAPISDISNKGFKSLENTNEIFVSNKKVGQGEGYGKNVIELKVKKSDLRLDDEFPSGEKHYALPTSLADKYLKTFQPPR